MKYQQWNIAQRSQEAYKAMERQGVPTLVAATLCARGMTGGRIDQEIWIRCRQHLRESKSICIRRKIKKNIKDAWNLSSAHFLS